MSKNALTLPELHQISSDCIRDLLADKISEKKSNAVATQTNVILSGLKYQLQGFKTFGKDAGFDMGHILYGSN